ncbi:hypothetical protein D0Z03_001481 [Geotrichum reessii]|nr:hypothetical protein D0Z03_001481 [Galactomyces reessii]
MSMAETYFLASKAQSKLTHEASKNNHNLRMLVSHANLLDNLMESLSKKKMLPETPLKQTYSTQYSYNMSHFSTIHEEDEDEEDEEEEEEDYSEDEYSEDEEFESKPYKQMPTLDDYSKLTPNMHDHEVQVVEINCDDEDEDDDYEGTNSTVVSSPESMPSLSYSSEEESEDEIETVPVKHQDITLVAEYKVSAMPISITTAHDVLVN